MLYYYKRVESRITNCSMMHDWLGSRFPPPCIALKPCNYLFSHTTRHNQRVLLRFVTTYVWVENFFFSFKIQWRKQTLIFTYKKLCCCCCCRCSCWFSISSTTNGKRQQPDKWPNGCIIVCTEHFNCTMKVNELPPSQTKAVITAEMLLMSWERALLLKCCCCCCNHRQHLKLVLQNTTFTLFIIISFLSVLESWTSISNI